MTLRQTFISSRQLLPGDWANSVTARLTGVQRPAPTASTTQTQAGATKILAASAAITTANANDAVVLPKGLIGSQIFLANLSANALGVFPAVGDRILPSAVNAVLAQTASKTAIYKCLSVDSAGAAIWSKLESA